LKHEINKKNEPKPKPSIGFLYQKDGGNFLLIEFWEDLPQAREEVKRFTNAKIVVKK
jgi:hypothetical protein